MAFPTPIVTPAQPALNPVTGCTQYPNTGATHLTEITCTASCEEHWYCFTGAGMTFLQNHLIYLPKGKHIARQAIALR